MREYGSEHSAVLLPDGYFSSFEQHGKCTWLRSGREALYLVALTEKMADETPTLLAPAYSCHSMIDPFLKAGWRVFYYPLNPDLTVYIECFRQLLITLRPDAVLTMNYFGSSSTDEAVDCVKSNASDCLIIEDFSHCTFSFDAIVNRSVDYYVSSIRKSIGVCDGAVVVSNRRVDKKYIKREQTDFSKIRYNNQLLKGQYSFTQESSQKATFYPNLRQQEVEIDNFTAVYEISSWGMRMLQSINGASIRYARQKNMEHILALLDGKVRMISGIERCLNGAPFSMPILVENRDSVQKQLSAKGVYAPVLWPICEDARNVCPVSARMADKMLSLPIDQRYDWDDIEDIAKIVLETV